MLATPLSASRVSRAALLQSASAPASLRVRQTCRRASLRTPVHASAAMPLTVGYWAIRGLGEIPGTTHPCFSLWLPQLRCLTPGVSEGL